MTLEQRYIISLLKNTKYKKEEFQKLDLNTIIRLLQEQKIFLHFYDDIANSKVFENQKTKLNYIYNKYIEKRKKYIDFFKKITLILNNLNIEYYLYKGIVLEYLIYTSIYKRQYDDIDIYIPNKAEQEMFIQNLKEEFKQFKDLRYSITPIQGEQKISIKYLDEIYTIEFKTKYHFCDFTNIKKRTVNIDGLEVSTFSIEDTLTYLFEYYYQFTRNYEFLRGQRKIKLQYAIDLYLFIKKYILCSGKGLEIIDRSTNKYNNYIKILNELYIMFKDEKIYSLISNENKLINFNEDILDKIPIYERFFNNDGIIMFLEKYYFDNYWFNDNPKYLSNLIKIDDDESLIKFININFDKNTMIINAKLKERFKTDDVIYINLFGYRMTGEFIDPYIPIVIRKSNKSVINSLYFAPRVSYQYDFKTEKEFLLKKYLKKVVKVIEGDENIIIEIMLNYLPYKMDITRKIGFNVYTFRLNKNFMQNVWGMIPYYKQPLLVKG